MLCIASCMSCRYLVQNGMHHNVGKTTQIVCTMKLRGQLATILNAARDNQDISSASSYTLHETVQTYDVEMTCQRSI